MSWSIKRYPKLIPNSPYLIARERHATLAAIDSGLRWEIGVSNDLSNLWQPRLDLIKPQRVYSNFGSLIGSPFDGKEAQQALIMGV